MDQPTEGRGFINQFTLMNLLLRYASPVAYGIQSMKQSPDAGAMGGTMKLTLLTLIAGCFGATAIAGEITPLQVKFSEYGEIETPLTDVSGDAANGSEVMTTRSKGNCVACHQITALEDAPFHGEVGPSLDGAGSRWTQAELRGLVANAKMTFDGSVMPGFYKVNGYIRPGDAYTGKAASGDLPPILTAQEVEDVVAFLMTLQDE